jgi:hypothetical protein
VTRASGEFDAFEDLARYPVDEEKRERLFGEQLECVVGWTNSQGSPIGVTHWFVWRDGRFWITCGAHRKRVPALRARPQSFVVVTSVGTSLGRAQSVTAKTLATIRSDDETKQWFFEALAQRAYPSDDAYCALFLRMLHETNRVVIELEPVQWISYDAVKMHRAVETARAGPQE